MRRRGFSGTMCMLGGLNGMGRLLVRGFSGDRRPSLRRGGRCAALLVGLLLAGCRMLSVEPLPETAPASSAPAGDSPVAAGPAPSPGSAPTATVGAPRIAVADVSALEGDGELHFTVTLSVAASEPVIVAYATADGTATSGADYTAASGTLTFAPQSTAAQQVVVAVHDDQIDEGSETLLLRLSNPHGAELAVDTATATIDDNDARAVIVEPAELNVPEAGDGSYQVVLGSRPTGTVTVTVSSPSTELTAAPDRLHFTPADWATGQTVAVTAAEDEDAVADAPIELAHTVSGGGYGGTAASAVRVTIVENDVATLAVEAARGAEEALRLRFAVTLSRASGQAVTVDYATGAAGDSAGAGNDYTPADGRLRFPAGSSAAQTVEVAILDDAVDEPDEQFTLTLSNASAPMAGGADTLTATGTIEDDDESPRVGVASASFTEGGAGGAMHFTVSLQPASGRAVSVRYATEDATAAAGTDYTAVAGTLTFPAGATVRTFAVPITDDARDEGAETFTVRLSAVTNATRSEDAHTATGTIEDNDEPPELAIADASLTEGATGGAIHFAVTLNPASGHTVSVDYATADGTATAGGDYTSVSGTLSIAAGTTAHTIAVPIVDDETFEETERFSVTLSGARHATLSTASATGTIEDNDLRPLVLSSLQVTGNGETMYPAFATGTHHYALACDGSATLRVSAEALDSAVRLTLRRADSSLNQSSTGTLDVSITVGENHDVAIELSDSTRTATYVVHCVPPKFPDLNILKNEGATEGLLFITPQNQAASIRFHAVADHNGVPRYHATKGTNFRPQPNGPVIDGKRVRYSINMGLRPRLLDANFERIFTVEPAGELTNVNAHDFVMTEEGNSLLISYHVTNRDLSAYTDDDDNPLPSSVDVEDGVIQEVATDGTQHFLWNSWDHLQVESDCGLVTKSARDPLEYAHLNSLQLVGGDVIASFRGCSQVLRIDRSSDTGAVEWQLGGTSPPRDSGTEYLELVGDSSGEFCKQHHATLTGSDTVVLFDNGTGCLGARKSEAVFSRVVEYDISSGTQAAFVREYRRADGQGYSRSKGGVTVLDNGNWLITWGNTDDATDPLSEIVAINEVDPATGTSLFEMNMSSSLGLFQSYRVYLLPENQVNPPLNLP